MILLFSVSLFLCCTVRSEHDVQEWVPLGEVGITLFLCVLLMLWACSLSEFPLVQNGCSAYIVQGKRLLLQNGFTIASYVIWELLKTLNGKFGGNFPNLELAVINYFLEILKKKSGKADQFIVFFGKSILPLKAVSCWWGTPIIQHALSVCHTWSRWVRRITCPYGSWQNRKHELVPLTAQPRRGACLGAEL